MSKGMLEHGRDRPPSGYRVAVELRLRVAEVGAQLGDS